MTPEPRDVRITYQAHLTRPHADPVRWTRDARLSPDNDREGPGHLLASMKTGSAGGVVVGQKFYPLSSIECITWEVTEV